MQLASFKANRPGLAGVFSIAVRWWLGGDYSHSELVFSDGYCGSSRSPEGGVCLRPLTLTHYEWDFIDVPGDEAAARLWFETHKGQGFDYLWLLYNVWRRGPGRRNRWGCSEAVAEALGIPESFRQDPAILPVTVSQRSILS